MEIDIWQNKKMKLIKNTKMLVFTPNVLLS